ncbi:pyridine nucleotide-disulfide oxidoreductase [Ancylobacter aquaticus]|uniref:Thioredoxin reductase n=1 Tax=Ancylobacter aquaticus TaxID=100 RepID=A0A4R1HH93_ANCAQ|nr:NAD(P)/FAD-dependent oxidoreductase [Ancylobacter aquaticus]TCK19805.1 pyridine nucleotide-disulfide oxidoreductase [Ancylobacter aquaticus]
MLTSHTDATAPIADCLIIGGGPAGLTAAIYLARFRRKVVLIDAGGSRASLIASTQNYPGFPEGISGDALLKRLGQQAVRFGARPVRGRVIGLAANGELFRANTDLGRVEARTIMLATGIVEAKPPLPGLIDLIRDGLIRLCPICDGYEVIDQQVTVIGNFAQAAGEALFLRTFTSSLNVLPLDPL